MENLIKEIDETTNHHFMCGMYAREMKFPKGWFVDSHKHTFDHMSILASGTAMVIVDNEPKLYKAPSVICIEKEKTHRIEALDDCVWFCIHKLDDADINTVEDVENIIISKKE